MLAGIALAAAVILVLHLREERQDALKEVTRRVEAAAQLIEEHARGLIWTTDFVLRTVVHDLDKTDLRNLSRSTWEDLRYLAGGLPLTGSVWVTDQNGNAILGGQSYPVRKVNLSDRAYFKAHQAGSERFVGEMVIGRETFQPIFTVSRRMNNADGSFKGVTVVAINAVYFSTFHAKLNLGANSASAIYGLDGRMVVHHPDGANFMGRSLKDDPRMMGDELAGSDTAVSSFDGVERLRAWRKIPELGLIVHAGVSLADALHEWREHVLTTTALYVSVFLMGLALARLACRSLAREEYFIAQLEEAVRLRTAEARAKAEQAEAANTSKSRFLTAASHDLRQPLQAVSMFTEILCNQSTDTRQRPVIQHLRQAVGAANDLLNSLMEVGALETGKCTPVIQHFPLSQLLTSLQAQLAPLCAEKGIALAVVKCGLTVNSDPVLLERAVRNLLVNAVRYTVTGKILLGCRRHGDDVLIMVGDTGPGIPSHLQELVFEDFARLDQSGSQGLGLGLGIVRRTAELLGHRVGLRSTPGKGSLFWLQARAIAPEQLASEHSTP